MTHRIIPRLDIKGPNLVKGIHLEGLRVLGKPEKFARYYYENGADELIFQDVVASLFERNSLHDIIRRTAKEIFIPLTVGGGLRSIEDIREVLRAGADKVSLNTAAIKDPELIKRASRIFGSSTIVIAIEAIQRDDGSYFCYTDNGREYTGVEANSWAQKAEEMGAGELIVTSVDKEGTGEGFDLNIISQISESVSIPVIAHGGAGKKEQILDVIVKGKADAIALASILHYDYLKQTDSIEYDHSEGNVEFLKTKTGLEFIESANLKEIKEYLTLEGIDCRYLNHEIQT